MSIRLFIGRSSPRASRPWRCRCLCRLVRPTWTCRSRRIRVSLSGIFFSVARFRAGSRASRGWGRDGSVPRLSQQNSVRSVERDSPQRFGLQEMQERVVLFVIPPLGTVFEKVGHFESSRGGGGRLLFPGPRPKARAANRSQIPSNCN